MDVNFHFYICSGSRFKKIDQKSQRKFGLSWCLWVSVTSPEYSLASMNLCRGWYRRLQQLGIGCTNRRCLQLFVKANASSSGARTRNIVVAAGQLAPKDVLSPRLRDSTRKRRCPSAAPVRLTFERIGRWRQTRCFVAKRGKTATSSCSVRCLSGRRRADLDVGC